MVALRTLSKDILGIVNRLGAVKRREDVDPRQIELWIHNYREQWLLENFRRDKHRYFTARPTLVQDLGCLVLQCVDQSECINLPLGVFVAKVEIPTPASIEGALDFVGVIDKRQKFIIVNARDVGDKLAAPYSKAFVFAYMIGPTTLYVATTDSKQYFDLCYINVREICADPTKACYKKSLRTAKCCFDVNNDIYPCSGEMIEDIKIQILTKEFNISMQYLRDFSNNNKDDRQFQNQQRRTNFSQ